MSDSRASDKLCVITGAARGIGYALAERFGTRGRSIVGVDVDAQGIEIAQRALRERGIDVRFYECDLGSHEDVARLIDELRRLPKIDVLIHNAGINDVGPFADSSIERQHMVMRVNLLAPMQITRALLDADKLGIDGTLVFIASLSHYVGYPGASVYAASKDGLVAFAESLRTERRRHVLTVLPGPTRTEHARAHSPDNCREHRRMAPERLAHLIDRAVRRRRIRLVPGLGNKFFALIGRAFPRLTEWMLRRAILDRIAQ